uniref:E3 ubiquitin ligase TRAF3IP2 n=1 Tax=Leptobrachium leishanense TaxID=445787 RepID=A0A8C5Q0L3_9ANUR
MNTSIPEENDESQYPPDKFSAVSLDTGHNSEDSFRGAMARSITSRNNGQTSQPSKDTGYGSQATDIMNLQDLELPGTLMSDCGGMEDHRLPMPRQEILNKMYFPPKQQWIHPPKNIQRCNQPTEPSMDRSMREQRPDSHVYSGAQIPQNNGIAEQQRLQQGDQNLNPVAQPRQNLRISDLDIEYRKVFITYSLDNAEQVFCLAGFLLANGFLTAFDLFEASLRGMNTISWMDGYLSNMHVKIIIAISPQYKMDVDSEGESSIHGLHTKYIHRMMQTQFINQGCINYRFIPILFPGASEEHVPIWLRNTIVYQWPRDMKRIILRLMCTEEYIRPPLGNLPPLTITPIYNS